MTPYTTTGYAPFYSLSVPSMNAADAARQSVPEPASGEKRPSKRDKREKRRRRKRGHAGDDARVVESQSQNDEKTTESTEMAEMTETDDNTDNASYAYMGMDREIAEEFILHSLQPAIHFNQSRTNQRGETSDA